jgi:hypothetical protein
MPGQSKEELSEKEIAHRRDDALRRALGTPHKPHKPIGKKRKSLKKAKQK